LFGFKTFVEASASWAPRKQSGGSIFELECADHAAQSVTQRTAFAPAAVPLTNYPEEENRRKKNQQIDGDKRRQADANHGAGDSRVAAPGAVISLPHSTVAIAQMVALLALLGGENRESRR
jgi:hypothetical protein